MSAAKKELSVAKGIRKNKEEYELLANMIEKVPSRSQTNKKLEAIKKELEELHGKQRSLEAKLADRRNHLHAFNVILANFCRFLKECLMNEYILDSTTNMSSLHYVADEEGDEMCVGEVLDGSIADIKTEKS
ncbi:unnamed protein product [Gongylonema pulchrum]|uniref:BHLH domain-containing protein n=1 Tax=Gongylonema pulchrum TaxID=637853 RepID=A0A183E5Y4_9BILA|nr:unnamed protein product [Gongylonema pulchrum]